MNSVNKIQTYMDAYANCGFFNGSVFVGQKGTVLLSKGYGLSNIECDRLNTPITKFRIASITKGFTAMAIMQLQEKGLLHVDDLLRKYIHDYPHGENIKIHHLLTHSSGIPNYTNLPHYDAKIMPLSYTSLEKLIEEFKYQAFDFSPGEKHKYCNSGYILLTFIIEQVSGMSYAEYLQSYILNPLGMNNTGYDDGKKLLSNRASGYHMKKDFVHPEYIDMSITGGAWGIYSTVEDLYLWDQALYTNILVSESSLETMFTPFYPRYGGYGWDISNIDLNQLSKKKIAHRGDINGYVAYLSRFVEDELTVIVLSNTTIAPVEAISNNLAKAAFGFEITAPAAPTFINISNKSDYVGEYVIKENLNVKITVTLEQDKLYIAPNGWHEYEIHPVFKQENETEFVSKIIDERFIFKTNDQGKVDQVIYKNTNGGTTFACK